ncbi:MAG: DUF6314 family protein [Amoebophilaceae bacterium]|jgi:hypothetical protein|nr:DUF6314 family protein [Amoebophilaceae bacterium]
MLQLFSHLTGVWELRRRLGTQGHMRGIARFQPWRKGILYYQEQGSATFGNNRPLPAYRAYAYVYNRGTIAVYFWDQARQQPAELLHTLQFHRTKTSNQTLMATGIHGCADDVYKARYIFVNGEYFQLTYQVHGPNKNHTIQTHFSKITNTNTTPTP